MDDHDTLNVRVTAHLADGGYPTEILGAIGHHLESSGALVDPILSIDAAGQVVTMNVEVLGGSEDEAVAIARRLLGEAIVAAGLAEEWHTVPARSVVVG